MAEELETLRDQLLSSAFLFDDPHAYRAGVEDALDALDTRVESPARAAS